jgi:hypothetical protein
MPSILVTAPMLYTPASMTSASSRLLSALLLIGPTALILNDGTDTVHNPSLNLYKTYASLPNVDRNLYSTFMAVQGGSSGRNTVPSRYGICGAVRNGPREVIPSTCDGGNSHAVRSAMFGSWIVAQIDRRQS